MLLSQTGAGLRVNATVCHSNMSLFSPKYSRFVAGALEEDGGGEGEGGGGGSGGSGGGGGGGDSEAALQRHLLNQRELFLSRQVETLPATHIRGKCSVTLLNETESPESYTNREVGPAPQRRAWALRTLQRCPARPTTPPLCIPYSGVVIALTFTQTALVLP